MVKQGNFVRCETRCDADQSQNQPYHVEYDQYDLGFFWVQN